MHCVFGMFLEGVTFKELESRFSNIKDSYMTWLGCIVMQQSSDILKIQFLFSSPLALPPNFSSSEYIADNISHIINVHVSVILEVLFTFPLQAHEDGGYIKLLVKEEVKERVSGPVQRVLNSFHSEVRTFVQYFIISKIYLNATNSLLMSQRRAL